ncbi:hypothetical protein BE21_56395 [Sorangium cellulosum]|uniref:Uncharacterized protein n=1 Tax=Sorangium cellulosum TaxID=56 RepID=A0A150TAG4_SORCE|nr:hypothetical protein BE21_56395 [Sorangium cellulosum]
MQSPTFWLSVVPAWKVCPHRPAAHELTFGHVVGTGGQSEGKRQSKFAPSQPLVPSAHSQQGRHASLQSGSSARLKSQQIA